MTPADFVANWNGWLAAITGAIIGAVGAIVTLAPKIKAAETAITNLWKVADQHTAQISATQLATPAPAQVVAPVAVVPAPVQFPVVDPNTGQVTS